MKYTLLEIVQEVLNEMDADFVNSIDETIESTQVAAIAKSCFNEMISNRNWFHLKKLISFEASNSLDHPTHMRLPLGLKELSWVKYDKSVNLAQIRYQSITHKQPEHFLLMVHTRNIENSNTTLVQDFSDTPIVVYNDRHPEYWTSFDDDWIVFDSYHSTFDDTLKSSKVQAYGYIEPSWEHANSAVPSLPEEAFAAFVEEVKSTAFLLLKQMPNQKAEQKAGRQQRWLARKAWKAHGGLSYPDFGRRSRK